MQTCLAYQAFRNQLSSLRVDSLVAGATSWAKNQPTPGEIDATALVSRLARNGGIKAGPAEVALAAQRVKQQLTLEVV